MGKGKNKSDFEFMVWSQKYGVYDGELDADHAKFIDLFNKLNKAVNQDIVTSELIISIFEEIKQHADEHFETEEKYMENHGYPSFERHKMEHRQFRRGILTLMQEFEDVGIKIADKLTRYLHAWLLNHMVGSDKDYAEYVKNKKLRHNVRRGNDEIF